VWAFYVSPVSICPAASRAQIRAQSCQLRPNRDPVVPGRVLVNVATQMDFRRQVP
jgi:hypothetical protein